MNKKSSFFNDSTTMWILNDSFDSIDNNIKVSHQKHTNENFTAQQYFFEKKVQFRRYLITNTVYVGNLSYHTKEENIWDLFFKIAKIKRIIIGLNRYNLTPCGFCFLEFYSSIDADTCVFFLAGLQLDKRIIRIDLDEGFSQGRQFGRGKRGGQIQNEKVKKKR